MMSRNHFAAGDGWKENLTAAHGEDASDIALLAGVMSRKLERAGSAGLWQSYR